MKLTVLGSGSRGNAFAVTAAGATVLLDAGFGPRTLIRRAKKVGLDLTTLYGVVLTHEHGDHARGASGLARKFGCPIYGSRGTLAALQGRVGPAKCVPLATQRNTRIGPFRIEACSTTHDANEPLALAVSGPVNSVKLGLAYDLGRPTSALRYLLRGATCLLMEANHDELMLRAGPYPPSIRERIGGSRGHLSNRAAGQLLAELCHRKLASVVLVHLSERCNTPRLATAEVRTHLDAVGFRGRLQVAKQDEPLASVHLADDPYQLELGVG